jgi:Thiopurine S-methyltransferase (TPMT)
MRSEFWLERWRSGKTGWDLGGPHPQTARLVDACRAWLGRPIDECLAYVPGCGRAHDAAFLAGLGAEVTGVDVSGEAIAEAKSLYGDVAGLHLFVGDAVSPEGVDARERGLWSLVFDRAMLNALEPTLRARYVDAALARLGPGGVFASIAITSVPEGSTPPPFPLGVGDYDTLFGTKARRIVWEPLGDSVTPLPFQEALAVYLKA